MGESARVSFDEYVFRLSREALARLHTTPWIAHFRCFFLYIFFMLSVQFNPFDTCICSNVWWMDFTRSTRKKNQQQPTTNRRIYFKWSSLQSPVLHRRGRNRCVCPILKCWLTVSISTAINHEHAHTQKMRWFSEYFMLFLINNFPKLPSWQFESNRND